MKGNLLLLLSLTLFFSNALAGSACCFESESLSKEKEVASSHCPYHKEMNDKKENKQNEKDEKHNCKAICCKLASQLPLKVQAPQSSLKAITSLNFYFLEKDPKNIHTPLLKPPMPLS